MKTLRILGMAAIAILMGVGFVSCSKESSDGDNPAGEKKLTKMVTVSKWGSEVGYIFTYDSNGKLSRADYKGDYWSSSDGVVTTTYTCQYSWNGNNITGTYGYGNAVFTQDNGLIKTIRMTSPSYTHNYTYTYSSNRLTKIEVDNGDITETTWNGDKLMKNSMLIYDNSLIEDDTYTLTSYAGTCTKGYCPLIPEMIESASPACLLYIAHPDLIEARTQQLPTSRTHYYYMGSKYGTVSTEITYEFDKDGYISKIHMADHYPEGEFEDSSSTYVLTWE